MSLIHQQSEGNGGEYVEPLSPEFPGGEKGTGLYCRPRGGDRPGDRRVHRLLNWLARAYSMELLRAERLELHARSAGHDYLLRQRILGHAEQTRRHAAQIKECIERVSRGKWVCRPPRLPLELVASTPMGAVPAAGGGGRGFEITHELWEIACSEQGEVLMYTMLATAAGALGFQETARICRGILEQKERFREWLLEHMAQQVRKAFQPR